MSSTSDEIEELLSLLQAKKQKNVVTIDWKQEPRQIYFDSDKNSRENAAANSKKTKNERLKHLLDLIENSNRQGRDEARGSIHEDPEDFDFIETTGAFECSICTEQIEIGDGVLFKNCLHSFCKQCVIDVINHSDDVEVSCPGNCDFKLQDREVRGLVPTEIFEKHLEKSLKLFESAHKEKTYHCTTPDCIGFIEKDANVRDFNCQVCGEKNCIACKAVHKGKTCKQYQAQILIEGRQNENAESEKTIKNMIEANQAMLCPRCGIPVMKDEGCDFITCTACKLGICWQTKKPRQPFKKENGEVIDGCHCNRRNGKPCHPKCNNCH